MADKGFDLKVLIPTDDGLTISENGIEKSKYYLTYNISNRSYQLAGKIKCMELYKLKAFELNKLENLIDNEKIDLVICLKTLNSKLSFDVVIETEIGLVLDSYIDKLDKKKR